MPDFKRTRPTTIKSRGPALSRRGFLAAGTAALGVRAIGPLARGGSGRRILTLVYDKSLGMMRAVERVVP